MAFMNSSKCLAAITVLIVAFSVHARPVFTILPFNNLSDKNDAPWGYTIPLFIKLQLKGVEGIRVSPDDSIECGGDDAIQFAYREASSHTDFRGFAQAVGRSIEADYVLWGSYAKETNSWIISMEGMDVRKEVTYGPITVTSTELPVAICEAPKRLLEKIGLPSSVRAGVGAGRLVTKSFAALDQFSHALSELYFGKPLSEVEARLRKALVIDPHFTFARIALGHTLQLQGKLDEAADVCKGILFTEPQYVTSLELAGAHFILGTVYAKQELLLEAKKEYLEANHLASQEPYVLLSLGQVSFLSEKYEDAVGFLQQGKNLAPFVSMFHQELARNYLALGRKDEALEELKVAERYDTRNNGGSVLNFGELYRELNETAKAAHYYEMYLAAAQRLGIQDSSVDEAKEALAELRPRLEAHFVESSVPTSITTQDLEKEVRRAALACKTQCSVNPFAANSEMVRWAKQLVGSSTNNFEKAKLIFDALSKRSTAEIGTPQARTAEEAFRHLQKTGAYISCQDFTFLFVALARAVGVSAYYVSVSKDVSDVYVLHACAGVFAQAKAILVDPAYFWFGVPHKEFAFKDDVEATGLFLSQSSDLKDKLIATNLAPRSALAYFNLAMELASQNQSKKAWNAYQTGVRLKGEPWLALATEGVLEYFDHKPEAAIEHLRQSLSLKPEFPTLHFVLGEALIDARTFETARDEFRFYLQNFDNPEFADEARERISYLNEVIKDSGEDPKIIEVHKADH